MAALGMDAAMKKEVVVDNFRRRPPMEGFSRPGSLGGEATDDDTVEGHIMDDQRQDQDTEGHAVFKADDDEDTEGHGLLKGTDDDDTEGHIQGGWLKSSEDDEDTEGHARIK
jgi:hypothetical protein